MPLMVTAVTAACLGLIYAILTVRVVMARGASNASLGDGNTGIIAAGQEHTVPLLVACRSHANFAEYVPICLILIALVEVGGSPRWITEALAAMLVLGRVMHPFGMGRKIPNPFRAGGAMFTLLVLLGASVVILVNVVRAA